MWNWKSRVATVATTALLGAPAAALTFTPLGDIPGGDFNSTAYAISNDGLTVVGTSSGLLDFEAFRWTAGGGMVPLADHPAGGSEGAAYGVSGNGGVIAGFGTTSGGTQAASWTAPAYAPTNLGNLGGSNPFSIANGVSGDGTTIVGHTTTPTGLEAFRYSGGTMTSLGDFVGGPNSSTASAVSDDGSVIVGRGSHFGPVNEAFRWQANVMTGLGDLAGGIADSRAHGVSGDGQIVVGDSSSANGTEAFIWSVTAGSMSGLGDLAGGIFESRARDASSDGSIIVGHGTAADGIRATIWNSNGQIFDLNEIVAAASMLPAGWVLEEAFGVSADGLSIVGRGSNALGNNEAWLLTIDSAPVPEPGTALLISLGLLGLGVSRRR